MQIISNYSEIKKLNASLALALGNFDGVHKGHQALLHKCVDESRRNGWVPSVLLWDPHPAQVLEDMGNIKFLNTLEQKYELISQIGIQYLFILPFNRQVAFLSPQEFVQDYLVNLFQVRKVFVGFNYSFGEKGKGTPSLLKTLGEQKGFLVSISEPVIIDKQIVSSSLIREKYAKGDMESAAELLGYYPTFQGRVVPGEQRGRKLGYPTANIEVSPLQALPAFGVYVAYTQHSNDIFQSIVNIGHKPTFNGKNVTMEVYLFNFNKNIYQERLKVYLLKKIRSEQKFNSKEDLQKQIELDIKSAYEILRTQKFKLS